MLWAGFHLCNAVSEFTPDMRYGGELVLATSNLKTASYIMLANRHGSSPREYYT